MINGWLVHAHHFHREYTYLFIGPLSKVGGNAPKVGVLGQVNVLVVALWRSERLLDIVHGQLHVGGQEVDPNVVPPAVVNDLGVV